MAMMARMPATSASVRLIVNYNHSGVELFKIAKNTKIKLENGLIFSVVRVKMKFKRIILWIKILACKN